MHTITWSSISTDWLYTLASRSAELTLLPEEGMIFFEGGGDKPATKEDVFPKYDPALKRGITHYYTRTNCRQGQFLVVLSYFIRS